MFSYEPVAVTILRGILGIAVPLLALYVGPVAALIAGLAFVLLSLVGKLASPPGFRATESWWSTLRQPRRRARQHPLPAQGRARG